MASRRLAVAALLLATAVARPAIAAPTAADRETARTLMEEGRTLRDRKDFQGALDRFQRADSIMHVPTTGYELAATQASLGLLVEARDTIAHIRSLPARPNEPLPFREARKHANDLDNSLAGRVPGLTIILRGGPAGVDPTVTIDDIPVPNAVLGIPRKVNPGHHVIVAKVDNAQGRQEVDVKEGETRDVSVSLVASGPAVVAAPVAPEAPAPPPPAQSHALTYASIVVGSVGIAGLGVGAVTGVLTLSKKSSLKTECPNGPCPPSAFSTLDSAHTLATVSTVAFIAGGVCTAAGVVGVLVGSKKHGPSDEQPPQAAIAPWFGPGGAGAAVTGRF